MTFHKAKEISFTNDGILLLSEKYREKRVF